MEEKIARYIEERADRFKEKERAFLNEGEKITQIEKILRYVEENGSITPLDAMREYGIMRLASRICDMRRFGYTVHKEMETAKNRYGEPVRYARYYVQK